jgi:hypothetical protein
MAGSSDGVFADNIARRGSGAYKSINEYLKTLDLGRVKPGFNSQTNYSRGLWEDAVKRGNAFGYYNNPGTVYGSMKSVLPYVIPGALGAGALSQQKYGGQPCYECGGAVKRYDIGGYFDCPDQEKDPVTGKCKAEVVRGKEAAAANKAANADMNAWAKQVAAMDKEVAKQYAAQAAGQLTFDYDWMQSPVDKADKKAAMAQYKQFFQQNPNVFVADDSSGYSPEQKYIIASKLKQRMSTPMGSKLIQQKYGVDPKFYDLQRIQSDFAPKMGGWEGMRNFLFNIYKKQGGPILDPRGQWAHPGKITRIPGSNITMQGVNYPVLGIGNNGQKQVMYPGKDYNFGGASYVDEYPMMQKGGQNSGKSNPFTEVNSTAADIFRNLLPLPDNVSQMLAKVAFQDARMSNNSLSDDQKLILWNTIQNAKKRSGVNSGGGTEYQDYGNQGYGSPDEFNQWFNRGKVGLLDGSFRSLTNPGFKLASTIGRGRYWQDPNNPDDILYTDVYDWNPSEANFKGSNMYQLLRNKVRSTEDKNLNKDKNDKFRMNFKLSKKEIEEIQKKRESILGLGLFKSGGQHGGLDRWFAEKWVDVKTGKACGRQEGEKRAGYPACRPSKRVNSQTPKTSSEMSSAEKAKFKASKTSSQRINYNHKRNK